MAKRPTKLTKVDLETDEVAQSFESALRTIQENKIRLLVTAALFLSLGVGAYLYSANKRQSLAQFSQVLNEAAAIFDEIPRMQDEETRLQRLRDTVKALEDQVINRDPDSEAAEEAVYLVGRAHYYMDDLDKAKASFSRYLELADTDEERARGQVALAYAHENAFYFNTDQNELTEALETFKAAQSSAPAKSYMKYLAMMGEARLLELQGQPQPALEIYKKVIEERPSPLEIEEIEEQPSEGFNIGLFARRQLNQQLSQVSLAATAKLRADRVEASLETLGAESPMSILTDDRYTSGSKAREEAMASTPVTTETQTATMPEPAGEAPATTATQTTTQPEAAAPLELTPIQEGALESPPSAPANP